MDNRSTLKLLKYVKRKKKVSRKRLIAKGYSSENLRTPYLTIISEPLVVDGYFVPQDTDIFSVSDEGLDFIEEYYYKDEPLRLSRRAICLSLLAILISITSNDFIRTSLYKLLQQALALLGI